VKNASVSPPRPLETASLTREYDVVNEAGSVSSAPSDKLARRFVLTQKFSKLLFVNDFATAAAATRGKFKLCSLQNEFNKNKASAGFPVPPQRTSCVVPDPSAST
jgi:hypothetical protein